ncbi:hypothetical protein [Pseudonocardia acidicola]|uniref:Small secreted protein n=1 Tax=Pseudonocardia acidicola TaxID=2724939 RepID=A0ABX1SKC1_9PSEU|nr:hypothetical protein [Pseudonocardia acidicola]NMI01258.1 hypothetical protein [Pseudonocardia acidicola]
MPRTSRPARLVAALGALLVAAGCGSSVAGTPQPAAAPSAGAAAPADAVAWTDKVCGAVLQFADAASAKPNITTSDPAAAVKGLSDYLGRAGTALQGSIDSLGRVGPSPVQGGDVIVANLTDTLTKIKTSFDTARTKIDEVDTSDPQAMSTAVPAAVAPLQELSKLPNPTAGLENNAELNRAAEQAPNCQKVRATPTG